MAKKEKLLYTTDFTMWSIPVTVRATNAREARKLAKAKLGKMDVRQFINSKATFTDLKY